MMLRNQRQHHSLQSLAAMPQRGRNKAVIIALSLWFTAAIIIFVWFGLQNATFTASFQQSKNNIRGAVAAAPAKLKTAHEAGDAAAMTTALREVSATVSQNVKSLPTAPSLFGAYIGGDDTRAHEAQLQSAATAYAEKLQEAADCIAYQSEVAKDLQVLSLKGASGYDQTIELANAWREAIQKLQQTAQPPQFASSIATLMQKMTIAETTIRDMAELYKKNDTAAFTAKQAQLTATIAEFKPLGEQLQSVATQLDAELTAAAAKLAQNL